MRQGGPSKTQIIFNFSLASHRKKAGDGRTAYNINKFEPADLSKLKPLLNKSAGYDIGLEDELEYFRSIIPMNWFYICEENTPIGFIRCFPQGTWGTVELFIDLKDSPTKIAIAELLLETFLQHTSFEKGFRLRFEIPSSDVELIQLIKEVEFKDRIETFLHYQKNLLNLNQPIAAHKAQFEDAAQIKNAIENLHEVAEEEVLNWIGSENIYIHRLDSKIASAAQVFRHGNSAEINRIATNSAFLRRGSALALLISIHGDLKGSGVETVFLKVDEQKVPARKLYEKVGYQRAHDKDQVWLSKVF